MSNNVENMIETLNANAVRLAEEPGGTVVEVAENLAIAAIFFIDRGENNEQEMVLPFLHMAKRR